jgi:hypothetical protein
MNGHTIPLGRVLGIPIDLDYTWFLIFVLLTRITCLMPLPILM